MFVRICSVQPGGAFQQSQAFLHQLIAQCSIQQSVRSQKSKGSLALWTGCFYPFVVTQQAPVYYTSNAVVMFAALDDRDICERYFLQADGALPIGLVR